MVPRTDWTPLKDRSPLGADVLPAEAVKRTVLPDGTWEVRFPGRSEPIHALAALDVGAEEAWAMGFPGRDKRGAPVSETTDEAESALAKRALQDDLHVGTADATCALTGEIYRPIQIVLEVDGQNNQMKVLRTSTWRCQMPRKSLTTDLL